MVANRPQRIVVTTDFSDNAAVAYPYGVAIARHFGAELIVLHVVTVHTDHLDVAVVDISNDYLDAVEADVQQKLNAVEIPGSEDIVVRRVVIRASSAAAGVNAYAAERSVDMICMSSHGRRVVGQILLGSVTRNVITHASCPVLCIKRGESGMLSGPDGRLSLDHILVPTDLTERCRTALPMAQLFGQETRAQLHLLHVVHFDPPATIFIPPGRPSVFHLDPDIRDRIDRHLIEWSSAARKSGLSITAKVLEGAPAREIARYADEHDIDLIVICRCCSESEPRFLGGVALRLLHGAHCPMLVV